MEKLEVKYVPSKLDDIDKPKLLPLEEVRMGSRCSRLTILLMIIACGIGVLSLYLMWVNIIPRDDDRSRIIVDFINSPSEVSDNQGWHREEKELACQLSQESGSCHDRIPRWYFNRHTGQCNQFIYSGCNGNANNFATLSDCIDVCEESSATLDEVQLRRRLIIEKQQEAESNPCKLRPRAGPCHNEQVRWFYDTYDEDCKKFLYGGCGGNENNFHTEHDCLTTCSKSNIGEDDLIVETADGLDACDQKMEVGICRASVPRWYFDKTSGSCKEFIWGGCQPNDNNFASKAKCQERCPSKAGSKTLHPQPRIKIEGLEAEAVKKEEEEEETKDPAQICSLKPETGMCRAQIEKFHFDPDSKSCKSFYWGGCGGNKNKFEDKESCEKFCKSNSY